MKNSLKERLASRIAIRQRLGTIWIVAGAVLTGTACFAFLFLLHFAGSEQAWSVPAAQEHSEADGSLSDLLSFQATRSGDAFLVTWSMMGTRGRGSMTLFRSDDGQVYLELYRQEIAPTSGIPAEGQYLDTHPGRQTVYYRLSTTDRQGNVSVYEPIAARLQAAPATTLSQPASADQALALNSHSIHP